MFRNVCRLCLGTENLVWIFNDKMAANMQEIISVTSGVEISKTDTVTQMVCDTCCKVTIKMYQFRTKSIKNDKDLKAKCAEHNISLLTNQIQSAPQKIKPVSNPIPPQYKFAHPSIKEVVRKYPNVKLPTNCLKSHVGAYITLLTDEVDEWYKEKNYTSAQIEWMKKEAAGLAEAPDKKDPGKKLKKVEEKPRPASPTNSAKRVRLSTESSDSSKKRKLRDKSDSDASSIVSVSSVKSVPEKKSTPEKSSLVETVGAHKSVKPGVKTRRSDAGAKSILEVKDKTVSNSGEKSDEITLSSLLKDNNPKQIREDITLKSLLAKPQDDDVIEIIDAPSPIPSSHGNQAANNCEKNNSNPILDEDLDMFSSRPFVKGSEPSKTTSDETAESDSEPIIVDLDSRSSSECSIRFSETDKTSFVEALELTPKTSESNQPDLSLVSLANKSHTLYTCRVCDSQHPSLKDLKYHMRRTHTKCPFCSKRFRNSLLRDEHVKSACPSKKSSPIKLKPMKLALVRVDEDEEIRRKYPGAFEDFKLSEDENVEPENVPEAEASSDKVPEEGDAEKAPKSSETPVCDQATIAALEEIEKFLNYSDKEASVSENNNAESIIYISDDEIDEPEKRERSEEKINVVNSEILAHINIHDNDVNVLKRILSHSKLKSLLKDQNREWSVENTPILDGSTSRIKIFKNLRKYLQQYKIPIEVKHSPTLVVDYKTTQPPVAKKPITLWHHLTPKQLRLPPPTQRKTNPPAYNLLGASTKPVNLPVVQSSTVTSVQPKATLSTVSTSVVSTANIFLTSRGIVSTANTSTAPLVLNGSTSHTKYANFIIVPNSLLTVPPTQGPLPVITSVTSTTVSEPLADQPSMNKVAQLESITNSLMPVSKTTNCDVVVSVSNVVVPVPNVVVPAVSSVASITPQTGEQSGPQGGIRVKNLQELS